MLIRALARAGGAGRCRGVIIAWGADQQRISILITKLTVLTKDEPCASRVETLFHSLGFNIPTHSFLSSKMRLNPIHLCCAAAVSLFLILGFTHFGTNEGISGFTGGFSVGGGMRGSMKSIMAKSEAIWEKTVRQRNEVMAKFGDMGL